MVNEKVIEGLKTRLDAILKNYFSTQYTIEEGDDKLVGKGFGKDAIIIDYSKSQIKYQIHQQFLDSFFKMNKLITTDHNLSTKYYCRPLSQTVLRLLNDYLEQPYAPLTEIDLNSNSVIAINGESIESIAFDTVKIPVLDHKKQVKSQKIHVMIVSTTTREYAFRIYEIIDTNIKSELSRELLSYFKTVEDLEGLMAQLTSTQSGLEGMLSGFNTSDIGF